jgi:hypothetical protein
MTLMDLTAPASPHERLTEGRVSAPWMTYHTDARYTDRPTKAAYIGRKYAAILGGSVLDVGCDQRFLRSHVARPEQYVGVDLAPPADVIHDLDRGPLPFETASFHTVVCTDVLEHLERIHEVFDALLLIARSRVILSLPAPVNSMLGDLWRGGEGWKKFYGLPVDPPRDRHRWFFGFEDARRFIVERSWRLGWRPEQLDTEWEGCGEWQRPNGEPLACTPNERKGALWCVLERAQ